jgi:hypothetical protein
MIFGCQLVLVMDPELQSPHLPLGAQKKRKKIGSRQFQDK